MSTKGDPRLTLRLDGPKITAEQFASAVNAFFDLLAEVSREITGTQQAVRWIIAVEKGSDVLHAYPEVTGVRMQAPVLVDRISRGMGLVERRAQRPRYFTDTALRLARELSLVPDGQDVAKAQIKSTAEAVSISGRTAMHVDRLLGEDVEEYGTIEGRLQTLSERRPHFAVYDPLTDRAIRCNVGADQLSEAWKAFGRRVAVSGLIKYRKTGQPVSIEAESIFLFPPDNELPTADDVYGILGDVAQ